MSETEVTAKAHPVFNPYKLQKTGRPKGVAVGAVSDKLLNISFFWLTPAVLNTFDGKSVKEGDNAKTNKKAPKIPIKTT